MVTRDDSYGYRSVEIGLSVPFANPPLLGYNRGALRPTPVESIPGRPRTFGERTLRPLGIRVPNRGWSDSVPKKAACDHDQ